MIGHVWGLHATELHATVGNCVRIASMNTPEIEDCVLVVRNNLIIKFQICMKNYIPLFGYHHHLWDMGSPQVEKTHNRFH